MQLPDYDTMMTMITRKLNHVGKNQIDLANSIGRSPSVLSRNISGDSEASYTTLQSIWDTLREWDGGNIQTAEELMVKNFTSVTVNETRQDAATKMIDKDFSQLPVRNTNDDIIGIISDLDIMKIYEPETRIGDIDYHHIIKVTKDTSRQLIENILDEGYPAVMVIDKEGVPLGIVTKADLLSKTPTVE